MIGKLTGRVDCTGEDWVILDVSGVGYLVHGSTRMLAGLPAPGEVATLWIETHVREDQIRLFGFASGVERDWFRLLQGVQGVGVKVSLAILSTLQPDDLTNAIALQDKGLVARAPGVGPKVAQRIVNELRDKAPLAEAMLPRGAIPGTANGAGTPVTDAVSALTNLGYGPSEASTAVAAALAELGEGSATEDLIRQGLKELAR